MATDCDSAAQVQGITHEVLAGTDEYQPATEIGDIVDRGLECSIVCALNVGIDVADRDLEGREGVERVLGKFPAGLIGESQARGEVPEEEDGQRWESGLHVSRMSRICLGNKPGNVLNVD